MGVVDRSDQMKVTCELNRRSIFCFYLRVFFDFLDIAVVNSKIVYNKTVLYICDDIIFNMIIHKYLQCNLFHVFLSKTPCNQNVIKANLNVIQNFFILLSIYEKLPLRTRGTSVSRNFPGNWQQA